MNDKLMLRVNTKVVELKEKEEGNNELREG